MIFDGFVHQLPDIDPERDRRSGSTSLDAVVDTHGKTRARFLLSKLLERARELQVSFPATVSHAVRQHDPAASRSRGSPATSTSSAASAPSSAGTRR